MYYNKHIFICTNQKPDGKKCCAQGEASDMVAYLKERLQALDMFGQGKVRVSASGCLGRCGKGPSLVIYPEGIWYKYQSKADIDQIIESHLIKDEVIEAMQMQ